ncbi:MAG: sigma-70 family RNA polymerase sigma factor [Bacillota bacterium]
MEARRLIDEFIAAYDELKVVALTLERDENDALDLMQDLAEILIVKGEELQDVRIPKAYFRTCLRHLKYNKAAKFAKETVIDPDDIEQLSTEIQVDLETSHMEIIEWLNRQLESSTPEFKEAFIKYHVEGHPLEYLARDLNMPSNTLSQKFSRMRRKLKKKSNVLYMAFLMLILYQIKMGKAS